MDRNKGLPRLGFGCMRLSKQFEDNEEMLLYAIEQGVDYFDTAYIYPGNEEMLGKFIDKHKCRDQMLLATKLPHYQVKKAEEIDKIFNTQLERLGTDYIDYYLIHLLPDKSAWTRMVQMGLPTWIENKKNQGAIKKIGFSYHGNTANFLDLLEVYDWDFCQLQYNYLDEHNQAGRAGVEAAAAKGLPLIIMEPLRGGLLATGLPRAATDLVNAENSGRQEAGLPASSPARWALKWLWDQEAVTCVLSGMNSLEMVKENISVALESPVNHLTPHEHKFFVNLKKAFAKTMAVNCTSCKYCMPCPYGVDIPGAFNCLNTAKRDGYKKGFKEYVMSTTFSQKTSNAGQCKDCGVCKKHCPQAIDIPAELKKVKNKFENPIYQVAKIVIKRKLRSK